MVSQPDRAVMRWLFAFCGVVAFLVVFGGFVRVTSSGLSIVEWKPVTGVVPPIGADAWRDAFADYRRSPEFLTVNSTMTLAEFQRIFTVEWVHRLVARLAGFAFLVPFTIFAVRRRIPRQDLPVYLTMGFLFVLQAAAGWIMVASGLRDRPAVGHLNLAVHLLLALSLLALALWCALEHRSGPADGPARASWSKASRLAAGFLGVLLVPITYGGLTAGLKAGHVAHTWPLMSGTLIPSNLLDTPADLVTDPVTVVFVHRWFAFVVLAMAVLLCARLLGRDRSDPVLLRGAVALIAVVGVQVLLGIATVLSSVQPVVALAHQADAVALFSLAVVLVHRCRALDRRGAADRPVAASTAYAAAMADAGEVR